MLPSISAICVTVAAYYLTFGHLCQKPTHTGTLPQFVDTRKLVP